MYLFGLELEGFYRNELGEVDIPPKHYPTDGFPGLVEVRTSGGSSLLKAYTHILGHLIQTPFDSKLSEYRFSNKERNILNSRIIDKFGVKIQNIYGKAPRYYGALTKASLQINISNIVSHEYRDKEGVVHPDRYTVFDFASIIRNLDEEFSNEIGYAKRQPGCYAIKGDRVEYRSLPNLAFCKDLQSAKKFIDRVNGCLV